MATLAERIDLNVADFADVAVAAEKDIFIDDDPGAGAAVDTHQDGVTAVTAGTEVVLG